ncbi:MAG: hypothetical protein AAFY57_03550 [Cyanobacteria bacterium J06642_2]
MTELDLSTRHIEITRFLPRAIVPDFLSREDDARHTSVAIAIQLRSLLFKLTR